MSTDAWFIKFLKYMSSQKSATNKSEVEYRGLRIHAAPNLHDDCIALIKQISSLKGANVLDIGAGEGAFSQRLIDEGFEVQAVDFQEDRFRANAECQRVDLNTDFHDKWTNEFDLIVAIEVIEHLFNPRHFINNCLRVLKSNGYLLLTSPNTENWISRIRFLRDGCFMWFDESDYHSYGHITPVFSWQIAHICEELGAELVSVHHTDNGFLRRRLGDGLSILRNKSFYLGALYPFMRGKRDGEINIYLIRKRN
jgi:SAM-dependent methyltransferase